MIPAIGYAAKSASSALKPFEFERVDPAPNEVKIDIDYCGICHSDVHQARNEWENTIYPCLPGHEIVGRIESRGANVTKYQIGDLVGVGCMIDSCRECQSCREGLEQYCEKGFTGTYNGNMRHPMKSNLTFGGYSNNIVVPEDFVVRIPTNLEPAAAAPLLCAGITTYSPMKHWKVGAGTQVAIVGLGGLGHVATKIAAAMGADVTVVTTHPNKRDDALRFGAKHVVVSSDESDMKSHRAKFDFILSTIPESHDINPYAALLKRDGVIAVVGCIAPLTSPLDLSKMIPDRKSIGSSLIGGIAETQEMLDFCSANGIVANIKLIPIDEVNEAFDKVDSGEIDFRYVIDMKSIQGKQQEPGLLERLLN